MGCVVDIVGAVLGAAILGSIGALVGFFGFAIMLGHAGGHTDLMQNVVWVVIAAYLGGAAVGVWIARAVMKRRRGASGAKDIEPPPV